MPTPHAARAADRIGRATRVESAQERYIEFAKRTLPKDLRLDGLRIVIDCANGAGLQGGARSSVGAWRRGDQDRRRAERPQHQPKLRFDVAAALVDKVVKFAPTSASRSRRRRPRDHRQREGQHRRRRPVDCRHRRYLAPTRALAAGGVVATVMSNLGLERYLRGLDFRHGAHAGRRPLRYRSHAQARLQRWRRAVGPHRVSDFITTGDGLVSALQVLASSSPPANRFRKCATGSTRCRKS